MPPKLPVEEEQAASAHAQAPAAPRRAPRENAVKWPKSPIPSPTEPAVPQKTTARLRLSESGAADPSPMSARIAPFLGRTQQATRDVVNGWYRRASTGPSMRWARSYL